MLKVTAPTLARALFTADRWIKRGADVTRCIKTPGEFGRWEVTLAWPSQAAQATRAQPATPAQVDA